MSITPIDMQVLLPNISKAARPENSKNARNESALQQSHIKEKAKLEIDKNKVSDLKKKDGNEIKNNQNSNSESNKKKRERKDKEDDEPNKINYFNHGSKFDIKV